MRNVVLMHEDHVTFFRTCMVCKEETGITVDRDEYARWRGGELIQNVWPDLDTDVRELYISGTHPVCWDTFAPDDEDEDGFYEEEAAANAELELLKAMGDRDE